MFIQPLRVVWSILLLFAALVLCAQGFNKRYDAFGQGYGQGAYGLERSSSGHVVFSFSYEPDTIGPDSVVGGYIIILQGLDEDGDLQWQKRYRRPLHGVYLGWADCCDTVAGGGFVVGGNSEHYWTEVDEARLVRFNAQGDSLWSSSFGSPGAFWIGQQVKHTSDGGFVICGHTDAESYDDAFVLKTDAVGSEQCRSVAGFPSETVDIFSSVIELDGAYIASGISNPASGDRDMYAVRFNAFGDTMWSKLWGGAFDDGGAHMYLCADGTALIGSWIGYEDAGESSVPYLAKMDPTNGELIWEHEYGDPGYSFFLFAAKECPNTDIIACGVTYEGGNEQGLLLRATSEGDSLWMRNYSYYDEVIDSCRGRFWDVLATQDGGFIMSGFANGPFGGPYPPGYSQDAWVVKVDSMGCVVPGCDATGVTELITNLQGAITVWPNPASTSGGEVQVGITLPPSLRGTRELRLSIVSATGQVAQVHAAHQGNNTVEIGALSSGLYFLHLTNGSMWLSGTKLIVE